MPRSPRPVTPSRRTLVAWMLALVAAVAVAAIVDATNQLEDAILRLAERQRFLAFVVAQDLSSRLALLEQNDRLTEPTRSATEVQRHALSRLLGHLQTVQRRGELTVLLRETDGFGFHTADDRVLASEVLERALQAGKDSLVLERNEAAALGLPLRRAVAGFATVADVPGLPPLRVVVLRSAQLEADRYRAARIRTAVTIGTIAVVILGFGMLLLRQQRHALELAAELGRAALERERDAELARADRFAMLATMSSGIAHELGGPLTILYGRLEQLAPAAEHDAGTAKAHAAMGEQLGRVRAIVRGFMALARGEAPALVATAPSSLASEAQELVDHRFARAGVQLRVETEPALPHVICDPPLFVQALVNLLVNACQASPPGAAVHLRIDASEAQVRFVVEDEGEGIGADVVEKARAPFFTTRAHAGGTGLGLAIANEIVQQNRGTLQIEPRADHGTRATIELPVSNHGQT